MTKNKSNGYGVASLILGILALVVGWFSFLSIPLSILAIVFASNQKKISPNGVAIAGLVLGIIGLVLWGVLYLIAIIFIPRYVGSLF